MTTEATNVNAEAFLGTLAGREQNGVGDYGSLCEICQTTFTSYYVEILEINDGESYILSVQGHNTWDFNCAYGMHPSELPKLWERNFAFPDKGSALDALGAFLRAAV